MTKWCIFIYEYHSRYSRIDNIILTGVCCALLRCVHGPISGFVSLALVLSYNWSLSPGTHGRAAIPLPTCPKSSIIAQVYRLSAVHCQMTRHSQRVPGYLTRYSVSANEISFDKKISQSNCVFQIRLGLEENDFPSPFGDFNRLFEGLIGELFKYDIEICFIFFKWHQSGP